MSNNEGVEPKRRCREQLSQKHLCHKEQDTGLAESLPYVNISSGSLKMYGKLNIQAGSVTLEGVPSKQVLSMPFLLLNMLAFSSRKIQPQHS